MGAAEPGRVLVRRCADDDVTAVQRIYAHHVIHGLSSFELDPPSVEEMTARFETVRAKGFPYLVAVEEGEVVGFAYAGPYRPRPAYRFSAEDSVYISPAAQGRGIGTLLLTQLVADLRSKGIRQVIAIIGDSGNRASIALHAKLGFQHVGVLRSVGWKHERWVDTVLMQLAIAEGSEGTPGYRPTT